MSSNQPRIIEPAAPSVAIAPMTVRRTVDGFTFQVGKPLLWLNAIQLGQQMTVDRKSIYRWRADGTIPREIRINGEIKILWEEKGAKGYIFSAECVPYLKAKFRDRRAVNADPALANNFSAKQCGSEQPGKTILKAPLKDG